MLRAYFDNNASTPVLPAVREAMRPWLDERFGNPSSIHQCGQAARAAVETAREEVAALVGAQPAEIVFTSGGTESDSLALWGSLPPGGPHHLVTTAIEHHAVLNVFQRWREMGHQVEFVPVEPDGAVRVEAVAAALRPETALLSVMMANNETGVLQPVADVAALARERRLRFHTDAIQAAAKVPIAVREIGCDLLSLSGHKMHAPAGVGALYVRRGVRLQPQILGGRHERGRRAGSENVAGIVGFGAAARLARADLNGADGLGRRLRDRLEQAVGAAIPECRIVGADRPRVPNTSNICFAAVEGEALLIALDLNGFCVSTGAACSSGALEPSHVLTAMGFSPARARGCLRFSFGRQNSEAEVDALLEILPRLVEQQRTLASRT